jgi:hypothetical protein
MHYDAPFNLANRRLNCIRQSFRYGTALAESANILTLPISANCGAFKHIRKPTDRSFSPAKSRCFQRNHASFRSFVTLPISTYSTTKILPA